MYNNEDRSWMYDRLTDGYVNQSFINGVDRFVEYASSQTNLLNRGKVKCPCRKCKNTKYHTTDRIKYDLYEWGFVQDYYVWVAHGESFGNTFGASSYYNPVESPPREDFGGCYREMVDDVFGGRYENVQSNQETEDVPTREAKDFYELLRQSETRISTGDCETTLEFVAQFMTNKILHNTTAASCNKWLKQLHKVLTPEDRKKNTQNVRGMKCVLKRFCLEKKTYDLCENNCFMYYGEFEASSYTNCPVCQADSFKGRESTNPRAKRIPKKKLWYFPLTSRLQRLYMSRATSQHRTWHLKCKGENDIMIHPVAGKAWKSFDEEYPDYAAEPRNVRLGLCTDGFTPWGSFGNSYSCWPVFVTPYNLPPDMCMRQEYIFLSLLIPGPRSPGKNLDLMLRPLIDELCSLWMIGAQTYDSFWKQNLVMRAHLMWTISDFPAYGMLSQWSTHGKLSCPYCMKQTKYFHLDHGKKPCWWECHRRFLPPLHPFRSNTTKFKKGDGDYDAPIVRKSGREIRHEVNYLPQIEYGNSGEFVEGFGTDHNWIRRSIFWELPYWHSNLIRHNLDVMHCEKNFFDNIKNTVMDDPDKTKDNLNSRKDLKELTFRTELYSIPSRNGQWTKKKAKYCLGKDEKRKVCEWVSGIKFPDGYASNINRCAQIPQLRLAGMKSHDCHIFMQRLLPIAFRDLLEDPIWEAITEVSVFGGCKSAAAYRHEMADARGIHPEDVPIQEVWLKTHSKVVDTVVKWGSEWARDVYLRYIRESIIDHTANMTRWQPLNKAAWLRAVNGAKKNFVPGLSKCGDREFVGFETRAKPKYGHISRYEDLLEKQTEAIACLIEANTAKDEQIAKQVKEHQSLKQVVKAMFVMQGLTIPPEFAGLFAEPEAAPPSAEHEATAGASPAGPSTARSSGIGQSPTGSAPMTVPYYPDMSVVDRQ